MNFDRSIFDLTGRQALVVGGGSGIGRAAAAELGSRGVRVNAIAPGVVEPPLTARIKQHPEWYQAYAEESTWQRWAQPADKVASNRHCPRHRRCDR